MNVNHSFESEWDHSGLSLQLRTRSTIGPFVKFLILTVNQSIFDSLVEIVAAAADADLAATNRR